MQRMARAAAGLGLAVITGVAQAAPCAGFTDVDDTSPFCVNVAWMKNRGITLGCSATLYCPNDFVTRLQMAAFMYRLGFQNAFVQGGNAFGATAVLGTTDDRALELRANDAHVIRFVPHASSPNLIGGHPDNSAAAGVRGATIGGGGAVHDPEVFEMAPNRAFDAYGTIGGGSGNRTGKDDGQPVVDSFATVGGGFNNAATSWGGTIAGGGGNRSDGSFSAVGGGSLNHATGSDSTIAGGASNLAQGSDSAIGGGRLNQALGAAAWIGGGTGNVASGTSSAVAAGIGNAASGANSHAAGTRAKALHDRTFVWGGSLAGDTTSTGAGQFVVYAPDRVLLYAGTAGSGHCEVGTAGVGGNLTCAGVITALAFATSSDRALKSDLSPVDVDEVLARVVAMPIASWRYRDDPSAQRHLGPTAQDFRAAFGLGASDTSIATVDADGVALAAIQGLNAKLAQKDAEIAGLRGEVADMRRALEALAARLPK